MALFLKYLCDLENTFAEGKNAKNEWGAYFELFVVRVHNASPEITVHLPFGGEKKGSLSSVLPSKIRFR